MRSRPYFVYILANTRNSVLYTGMTSDLCRRLLQHRLGTYGGSFAKRYRVWKLVYYETSESAAGAIAREKQIKAGRRSKKVALIEETNPTWADLGGRLLHDPLEDAGECGMKANPVSRDPGIGLRDRHGPSGPSR